MAVYTGKIEIVNMNNIAAAIGVGIQNVKILYAISGSGIVPPDLVDVDLITTDNQILTFASTGASFRIKDGILWAWQGGVEVPLRTEDEKITGIKGWSPEMPEVHPGNYLWTKTIYTYSDGSQTVTYGVFRQGEDGLEGAPGINAELYHLEPNQSEILKFVDLEGNLTISPSKMDVTLYKFNPKSREGRDPVKLTDQDKLVVEIYSIYSGEWIKVPESFSVVRADRFQVDLSKLLEEDNEAANILKQEECILKLHCVYKEDGQYFNAIDFLNVRHGISKDMAHLSVSVNKIVASMQDSKLEFGASGLTIKNGSFSIVDSNGEELLYFNEETGNLHLIGDVYAENGEFRGDITGATGTFSGRLEAEDGYFRGEIGATSGKVGGFTISDTQLTSDNSSLVLDGNTGIITLREKLVVGDFENLQNIAPMVFSMWGKGLITAGKDINSGLTEDEKYLSTLNGISVYPAESYYYSPTEGNSEQNITIFMYDTNGGYLSVKTLQAGNSFVIPEKCYYVRLQLNSRESYKDYQTAFEDGSIDLSISKSRGNSLIELKGVTSPGDEYLSVKSSDKKTLSFKADGTLQIGNEDRSIVIDGGEGTITSLSYGDGQGWKLANDEAIFNNVTVRGSIRASVLEYGETQAIGGALLVRPSTRIIESVLVEEEGKQFTLLTVEEVTGFNVGDQCRIDFLSKNEILHKYFKVVTIQRDASVIKVAGNASETQGKPIVSFGHGQDNVGISINGSTNNSFGASQAISVFECEVQNDNTAYLTPRVILGKIPNEQTYGHVANSYGLYAENALLKGSLVTQTGEGDTASYSGISTIYGQNAPVSNKYEEQFGSGKTGEILLWAGAEDTAKESIEDAKFFVDRNGNLFARSAYFEGPIISNSTIEASIIKTAILEGRDDNAALLIKNAINGIEFVADNEDGSTKTVFKVSQNEIQIDVPSFIFNNNFQVLEEGALIIPELYLNQGENALKIKENQISCLSSFERDPMNPKGNQVGYVTFGSDFSFYPGNSEVLRISKDSVSVIGSNSSLYIENSVQYGKLMKYTPVYNDEVLIGYDLYVE